MVSLFLVASLCFGQSEADDATRVQQNKQTVLERLRRQKATYRGSKPGEMRLRWEWYNSAVNAYLYEVSALLLEQSYRTNSPSVLREGWVFKNMRLTFFEVLGLTPEEDDKLVPILSHRRFLSYVPSASLTGLTLRGKQGEVKGTIVRKVKMPTLYGEVIDHLMYKNSSGKELLAFSVMSYDAFTILWKDLKDKIAVEVSEAHALENLRLERDLRYPEQSQEKEDKK